MSDVVNLTTSASRMAGRQELLGQPELLFPYDIPLWMADPPPREQSTVHE
jgi:hypothetical protein